jgi:hypothetical protein
MGMKEELVRGKQEQAVSRVENRLQTIFLTTP